MLDHEPRSRGSPIDTECYRAQPHSQGLNQIRIVKKLQKIPCQVIAVDQLDRQLMKETAAMRKSNQECSHVLEVSLTVALSLLAALALVILAAVIYYHRKRPIQRLQRARSRVYSRIYPRERYERPYTKDEFLKKFSAVGSTDQTDQPDGLFLTDHPLETSDLMEQGLSRFNSVEQDHEKKADFLAEEFCELVRPSLSFRAFDQNDGHRHVLQFFFLRIFFSLNSKKVKKLVRFD